MKNSKSEARNPKNTDEIAIKVTGVSKTFKLPHEKNSSIKNLILNPFKRRTYEKQRVLKDISFEIKKGEFFGIVGRNGSGKSTLLKLLAGIYSPDKGTIEVNGKLTPFIELGVGFNPELTGRENVFLNGALLGFNRKEMSAMYDEIVEFAEIEKFMDQKLKNYSSGMQVRLAFSIAIRANSDILVLDEVLAVGDANFQKKCYDYFLEIKERKKTVILVTHDMSAVKQFCTKVIYIENGIASKVLSPVDGAILYQRQNFEDPKDTTIIRKDKLRWGTKEVTIESIRLNDAKNIKVGDDIEIYIYTESKNKVPIVIGLAFVDQFGVNIAGPNSKQQTYYSNEKIAYKVRSLPLAPGLYTVTVAIFDKNVLHEFDHIEKSITFQVTSKDEIIGKIRLNDEWSHDG